MESRASQKLGDALLAHGGKQTREVLHEAINEAWEAMNRRGRHFDECLDAVILETLEPSGHGGGGSSNRRAICAEFQP